MKDRILFWWKKLSIEVEDVDEQMMLFAVGIEIALLIGIIFLILTSR